ncbi:MAG: LysR substrate-binding domain-containing protein [Corticimicrobacter sp.]|uniref:LysR family transcriptional regulator n=1 Tax=Corticimicrobacter sp. TaxID=2678536 RepID=UPI0032DA3707
MDLDDLDIFRCVVREGGIARAAARLHRVPSNITTRIKQLEARLGVALFRKQGRSLALTESGQTLLGHAERLLLLAEQAEQEVRNGTTHGTLRLGSLESTAGARLPSLLSTFHLQHPGMSIELQTGITDTLLRMLARFEIDAAFIAEPFEPGRFSSRPAFNETLTLISAQGTPRIQSAADLSGQTLVVFPHGCSYRRRLTEWLAEEGVTPGRILEFGSYHAIIACVAAATGIGIISTELLDHAVLGTAVQRHPLPDRLRLNRTHLVWTDQPGAPLQALMALLP